MARVASSMNQTNKKLAVILKTPFIHARDLSLTMKHKETMSTHDSEMYIKFNEINFSNALSLSLATENPTMQQGTNLCEQLQHH